MDVLRLLDQKLHGAFYSQQLRFLSSQSVFLQPLSQIPQRLPDQIDFARAFYSSQNGQLEDRKLDFIASGGGLEQQFDRLSASSNPITVGWSFLSYTALMPIEREFSMSSASFGNGRDVGGLYHLGAGSVAILNDALLLEGVARQSIKAGGRVMFELKLAGKSGLVAEEGVWQVGPHGEMQSPRPLGTQSHHGVNSVWMKANVPGYSADDAPAILMKNDPFHNATRGVFNRMRAEIAARQGVSPGNIDWSQVSPGTAWRLAEEQLQAAKAPADVQAEYFRQFNQYFNSLR